MTTRRAIQFQVGLFAVSCLYTLYMAARMPAIVPTHWNYLGQPDAYGSKWMNLLFGPALLVFTLGLWVLLPKISPKNFQVETFRATYDYVMLLVNLMMLAMQVIIVQSSLGAKWDMTRLIMVVLFAFFALMGNVLGRVKRNYWMGIRTPWTLSSDRVWEATHRAAGKLWFIGGLVGAIAAIVMPFPMILMAYLLVISFIPVFQSYFLYRRLEG